MHAKCCRYKLLILVILSFCLNNASAANSEFYKKETLNSQQQFNFSSSNPNPSICGIDFLIFDYSCTASNRYEIMVNGITPDQLGIDIVLEEVRFIIEHTWDNDLDITLESPNNVVVELSTDNGGGADNYGDPSDLTCASYTALSMSGCQSIVDGNAPFIGTYIPEGDFDDFHDGSDPNGIWTLQICDDAASDVGSLQFVELVFSEAVCDAPADLTLESFDSTAAQISWAVGSCASTIIEYGSPGFVPGTGSSAGEGTVVSLSCPVAQPYVLTNLSPETEYEVYIRNECSSGGFVRNPCSVIFKTDCTTPVMTLSENFDTQVSCSTSCSADCDIDGVWSNSINDDFDWLVDANGTTSSNTGPSDDITGGGNYVYIETSGGACQGASQADLVSTCLLIGAESESCHLSFYYHMFGTGVNTLSLDISLNDGLNWINMWSLSGDQGDRWEKVFIDLGAFHDNIAKLRFSALGGINFRGDIAIDNIQLYGTTVIGEPAYTFYFDNDGDGFGDMNVPFMTCTDFPPANYVENNADCDDNDAFIHPNALEIPCNAIDENCNGMTDDNILADPVITNTDFCLGESVLLEGSGNLYWYDSLIGGNLLFSGNTFDAGVLTEDTVFYVVDSLNTSCKSQRVEIGVSLHPNPELFTTDMPEICQGENFDLSSVNIIDFNNTMGTLSFHNDSPANDSNKLGSPIVSPVITQSFYILSTTAAGCTDEIEVIVLVNSAPQVVINSDDTLRICKASSQVLTSQPLGGGVLPFSYEWSNGSTNTLIAITAGTPGTIEPVWLAVTDSIGCAHVDTVFIETVESITSTSTSTEAVTSCGGNDGIITVTPLDGIPPYQISWSGPVNGTVSNINGSYDIQNLEQGAYSINISDSDPFGLGCQMTVPVVIVNGPSATIDPNILISDASCVGASDGSIDISVTGNNPTFLWSNSSTTEDISNIPSGTYSVTVTDGNCTNVIDDIEVEEPDTFSYYSDITDVSCFGMSDGSIEVFVSGGTIPYTINWNNATIGSQNNDLTEGVYDFNLTDANGCIFNSDMISVNEPEPLELEILELINPSCFGGNDGSLDISITGGTAPYSYDWNNGAMSEDLFLLEDGEYQLTVTDVRDCELVSSSIFISEPSELNYNITNMQAPSCNNLSDGAIEVEISGGTPPYFYNWSNGAITEDATSLEEGVYGLTVTDSNNCDLKINGLELVAPSVMSISLDAIQNAFCDGVADGSLDVSITGGTSPYFYNWNNGELEQDLDNLEAGDYQLTVTDNNGCTSESVVFTISAANFFNALVDEINDVNCYSDSSGSIYISMIGGLAPYDFNWNNGIETEDIENLPAGDYFATISDANSCVSLTDTFTIIQPLPINIEIISVESPSCNGFENGSIDVNVTGGDGSYIYSWNNGTSTEDLSNAASGQFQLTVLDENNCVAASDFITLDEPEVIEIGIESITHVGCSGIEEGSIEINTSGGVAPFEFEWSTGDTLQNISGIPTGFYAVTVTDFNGCESLLSSIEVQQLDDGFEVEADIVNNVTCHEASDGSISILMNGGTAPFQYNWSNGVTSMIISNLQGGFYNVTITDVNGCVGISPMIEIDEPMELQYLLTGIGHNDCFDANNGFLEIETTGGTNPYNFLWSTGDTTQNISNLPSGSYSLTITDANGCSIETDSPFEIQGPDSNISVSVLSQNDVPCFGFQNGSIVLSVDGGVTPYSYTWNTGDNTATISQLSGGIYICEVTDANNCITEEITIEITEPDSPLNLDSISIVDNINCNDSIGSITLYMSGGTPLYNFLWNNGGNTATIENLEEGFYECTITDQNGCFYNTDLFNVLGPLDDLELDTSSTPETLGASNGTATVAVNGGTPPYTFLWDSNTGFQVDSIAVDLTTGSYTVTVTDASGCTSVATVEVGFVTNTDDPKIFESFHLYPNPTSSICKLEIGFSKQNDVKIELYNVVGRQLYTIEKDAIEISEIIDFSNFTAGIYFLKITINNRDTFTQKIVFTP